MRWGHLLSTARRPRTTSRVTSTRSAKRRRDATCWWTCWRNNRRSTPVEAPMKPRDSAATFSQALRRPGCPRRRSITCAKSWRVAAIRTRSRRQPGRCAVPMSFPRRLCRFFWRRSSASGRPTMLLRSTPFHRLRPGKRRRPPSWNSSERSPGSDPARPGRATPWYPCSNATPIASPRPCGRRSSTPSRPFPASKSLRPDRAAPVAGKRPRLGVRPTARPRHPPLLLCPQKIFRTWSCRTRTGSW